MMSSSVRDLAPRSFSQDDGVRGAGGGGDVAGEAEVAEPGEEGEGDGLFGLRGDAEGVGGTEGDAEFGEAFVEQRHQRAVARAATGGEEFGMSGARRVVHE